MAMPAHSRSGSTARSVTAARWARRWSMRWRRLRPGGSRTSIAHGSGPALAWTCTNSCWLHDPRWGQRSIADGPIGHGRSGGRPRRVVGLDERSSYRRCRSWDRERHHALPTWNGHVIDSSVPSIASRGGTARRHGACRCSAMPAHDQPELPRDDGVLTVGRVSGTRTLDHLGRAVPGQSSSTTTRLYGLIPTRVTVATWTPVLRSMTNTVPVGVGSGSVLAPPVTTAKRPSDVTSMPLGRAAAPSARVSAMRAILGARRVGERPAEIDDRDVVGAVVRHHDAPAVRRPRDRERPRRDRGIVGPHLYACRPRRAAPSARDPRR